VLDNPFFSRHCTAPLPHFGKSVCLAFARGRSGRVRWADLGWGKLDSYLGGFAGPTAQLKGVAWYAQPSTSSPVRSLLRAYCSSFASPTAENCNRLISANGDNQRGCWVTRFWQCRRQGAVRRHVRGPHARLGCAACNYGEYRRSSSRLCTQSAYSNSNLPFAAAPVVTDCHVSIRALLPQAGDLIATGSCQTRCGHTHSGRTPFRSCE